MLQVVDNHLIYQMLRDLRKDIEQKNLSDFNQRIILLHDNIILILISNFDKNYSNKVLNDFSQSTINDINNYINFLMNFLVKSIDMLDLEISNVILNELESYYLSFLVI